VALALAGLFLFTHDPGATGSPSAEGDLLCIAAGTTSLAPWVRSMSRLTPSRGFAAALTAAVFYATYDLRLFHYGKLLGDAPDSLIRNKVRPLWLKS
jgi:drug/metabolite transporter (DMT)-like permease